MGHRLDRVLESLPRKYAGPGGAVAVLKQGEVLERYTWGWANAEERIPFTSQTLFRICSITKQFACGTALELFPDLAVLDADVSARLPQLKQQAPTMRHLCNNQSGLRDYWAVAMLHGSPVEAMFTDAEAARVIGGTRTLHFEPGTRYSYANQNFRLIADILQQRAGKSFAELLQTTILQKANMQRAGLLPDTSQMPDGTMGYEGSPQTGYRSAVNNIHWTGDAGMIATLEDMIAWERYIDSTRDDPNSLYQRLSQPVQFADAATSAYGFGLARRLENGRQVTTHSGMLRGWRSHRLNMASERISVVVMFNHMADPQAAALELLSAALEEDPPQKAEPSSQPTPLPAWLDCRGDISHPDSASTSCTYLEPETSLATRLESAGNGKVRLRYGHITDLLDITGTDTAGNGGVKLQAETAGGSGVRMHRILENQHTRLQPAGSLPDNTNNDVTGNYYCEELDAYLTIADAGKALYGACKGVLGQGRMELLEPVGNDLWLLPCLRSLDAPAPAEWTLRIARDAAGKVNATTVGCVLARKLTYRRLRNP